MSLHDGGLILDQMPGPFLVLGQTPNLKTLPILLEHVFFHVVGRVLGGLDQVLKHASERVVPNDHFVKITFKLLFIFNIIYNAGVANLVNSFSTFDSLYGAIDVALNVFALKNSLILSLSGHVLQGAVGREVLGDSLHTEVELLLLILQRVQRCLHGLP